MTVTIHAGMPKTGTTSLQLRLSDSGSMLAAAGVDYPLNFRDDEGIAHHRLAHALRGNDATFDEATSAFVAHLTDSVFQHTIISSEALTNAINGRFILRMMNFLATAAALQPVRLVVVLRPIESFFESMYLHSTKVGDVHTPIDRYLAMRYEWSRSFFGALTAIRTAGIIPSLRLVKFDPTSAFDGHMLTELQICHLIQKKMAPARRANEKLSWKAQTILLHLEEVEGAIGSPLPRHKLFREFGTGIMFQDDLTSYTILSEEQEGYVREGAFSAAYDVGLWEYLTFFNPKRTVSRPRVSLDWNVLTADDLDRLKRWAEQPPTSIILREA
jgi:hypothetical protein